ncbi:hypothetical protein CHH28_16475 [Bacterioplanes sanyensis]|uniref:DUF3592 domain-containing protein n=1 Tax=Bacterioplanes sanyensis TaxID=1249553 RepID=A0A222FPK6_9GAMM|nr:DUF3592 domain-containing protein [Bacterioplanes sanyensis]ASP40173.1 hypothetical protein CHH28_16475 [Bacterioplanes sanyensis]
MVKKKGNNRIFGWLFLAAGVGVFIFTAILPLIKYWQSSDWQPVNATLTRLELQSNTSEDSTTYKVVASYHFQINGQQYRSHQVSLFGGSDNIGSYWSDLYSRLKRQRDSNAVIAWVNPQDPTQSLLDRSLRPGFIIMGSVFLLAFGGIGLMVVYRGQSVSNSVAAGSLSSEQKGKYKVLLVLGTGFTVLGVAAGVSALHSTQHWQWEQLLIALFPLAGIAMLVQAIRARQRFLAIGVTPLLLDPDPASSGGHIAGSFQLSSPTEGPIAIKLQCINRYTTGSGDDRKTEERVVWEEQSICWHGNNQTQCFLFSPNKAAPASGAARRGIILWRLTATGSVRPSGQEQAEAFERSWQIPVKDGIEHSSLTPPERHTQHIAEHFEADVTQGFGIRQQGQETYFISAAGRHMASNLGLMAIGAVFSVAGVFLFTEALQEGGALWFMSVSFFAAGMAVTMAGIWTAGRKLETWISPGNIRTQRSLFGKPLYTHQRQNIQPDQLKTSVTSSSRSGSRHTEYYRVHTSNNNDITLAEGIDGKAEADALVAQMRKALTGHLDDELG